MRILRIRKRLRHIHAVARLLSPLGINPSVIRKIGYRLLLANQLGMARRNFTLNLEKDGTPFEFNTNEVSDFSLLHDLMVQEEYSPIRKLKNISTVIDLGGNIGMSVLYLKLCFPDARILCYEPDVYNYHRLLGNVRQFTGVEAFNIAVGGRDGEIEFFEHPTLGCASSVKRISPDQISTRVRMQSFDNLMAERPNLEIDLVKFDIEGAEYELFQQMKSLSQVRAYIGELHLDMIPCNLEEFCGFFKGYDIETAPIGPDRYSFFALRKSA